MSRAPSLTRPNLTAVDGIAIGRGFALPQRILRRRLADFLLVTDGQIAVARRLLATHAHTLAEGAGAAALAAVLDDDRFCGKQVAVICTGGNASPHELADLANNTSPDGSVARKCEEWTGLPMSIHQALVMGAGSGAWNDPGQGGRR
jgi:threonine dehydratase